MNACYCGSRECLNGLRHKSPWGTVQMVRCLGCGAHRTADMPTPAQVAEMYAGDAIYRPGRLLEISCNAGYALEAFKERGWNVTGREPNAATADHARGRGGPRHK